MARSLMDTLSEDFDLDALHDDYAVALQELIDSKLGDTPVTAGQPAPSGGGKILDLMGALQSSVKAAKEAHAKTDDSTTERLAPKTTAAKKTAAKSSTMKSRATKEATPAKKTGAKKSSARKAS